MLSSGRATPTFLLSLVYPCRSGAEQSFFLHVVQNSGAVCSNVCISKGKEKGRKLVIKGISFLKRKEASSAGLQQAGCVELMWGSC